MAAFHEFDFFTAGRSGVEFGAALLQIMGGERARIGRNKREFANDADLVWKNPIVGTCGKLPQLGDIEQTIMLRSRLDVVHLSKPCPVEKRDVTLLKHDRACGRCFASLVFGMNDA